MDLLEELRFARTGISDDTDVKISSKVHSFRGLLVHPTKKLKQDSLLDILVA